MGDTTREQPAPPFAQEASPTGRGTVHVEADGILEMVNWRTGEFSVRDDVGHVFELSEVANADTARRYVGLRVQAHGEARHVDDDVVQFEPGGTVDLVEMPDSWFAATLPDLESLVRAAPGPDLSGGVDLNDEELASFLAVSPWLNLDSSSSTRTSTASSWSCVRRRTRGSPAGAAGSRGGPSSSRLRRAPRS